MRMLVVEGPNALKDRFLLVEGLSGWKKNDTLRGEDSAPSNPGEDEVGVPGLTNVLDAEGIKRINGLAALLPEGATEFGAGDIIIGGSGSDQIWGNGADDIIDGDKWLNVRLSVRTDVNNPATETRTVNTLKDLQADIMAGKVDPGNVAIVREIVTDAGATDDVDTANYSGAMSEYTIDTAPDGVTTVAHTGGTGADGTDRITNVEKLKFTDTELELNDTTIPTVSGRTPAPNATNVAAGTNVTATFSEAVLGIDGSSVTLSPEAGAAVAATVTYDQATRTATLDPTADLQADTVYRVDLTDAIADAAGLKLAATNWTFTTAGPAPTVTGRTPAADATNVLVNSDVTATFSEPVNGTSDTTMKLTNPAGDTISAAVSYSNGTATLNPNANLAAGTRYTVSLTDGITDNSGNKLEATTWSFTTDAAPTVTGWTPASEAKNVKISDNVTAKFSETVTGVGNGTMTLATSSGATVSATVSYSNGTATLNPNANLALNTRYTAKLTNGIKDLGGNALTAMTWSFTTDAAPTVTGRTPASNATNVSRTDNITATFSETVTGATSTNVKLTRASGSSTVTESASVSYNSTTRTVTLNPSATLKDNTRYTVRLSNGIKDLNGNALTATTWTFTTDAAPTVTGRTPASNATNVSRTGNITVKFSETVSGATSTNVKLTRASGSSTVTESAKVSYNSSTRTVTLNPSSTLRANTRYTVRLSSGIKDARGNALTATTWTFRTGSR